MNFYRSLRVLLNQNWIDEIDENDENDENENDKNDKNDHGFGDAEDKQKMLLMLFKSMPGVRLG